MKYLRILIILLFLSEGCIAPLPVEVTADTPVLVVDGSITNAPPPYQVRLSYSTAFDTPITKSNIESGAIVSIISDEGELEVLFETSPGVYESSPWGMQGQVGRSYHVEIITASGKEFYTDPQKMLPAGSIDSVYTQFHTSVLNGDNPSKPQDALGVYVNASDAEKEARFFRWRWTGIYHARTFPQFRTKGLPGGATVPDPPACSGYIVEGNEIRQVAECTCCSCWPFEYSSAPLLSDTRFTNQYTFNNVPIVRLPVIPMRFFDKYFIEIEQLSISEEVHEFWRLAKVQQEATGSLFQPNAVKVSGNIRPKNSTRPVLGIFSVSAITKTALFLTSAMLPHPLPPIDEIAEDCTLVYTNGSNQKPSFW